ncbi:hypothetical protein KL918_004969 [Ogataea parapolymorpha]|uniref:Carbonic anhydrase n=1 Tax=Ogataea parapolymorpha (strain ATCC 26012 / BCRC 20466 / JCM 22074 / NRRL Y-7560 / DL-1) TaxID=871575 RepID=W1QGH5_OGAPD|nr:Carbonic anhydrase [Ogataea parapolymorpha DL-1]ESX00180.1 Carbonic anhydrase [Ogataea parapolymorpha DL-1]KAG7865093.1 hypothetical protein KL918_004969 [Ogataea parapolymorpha]KAG7872221.1 hypothetical protein KL916_003244 [Ogataea parapolymorpha]
MGINNVIRYEHEQEGVQPRHHHHPHKQTDATESEIELDKTSSISMSPSLSSQSSVSVSSESPFQLDRESTVNDILQANRSAMKRLQDTMPAVLEKSGKGQSPHTLWVGCSDSRVNECTTLGCVPGEVFTLRNIANLISYQDFSSMSALQFAIDVLKVKRIIVCGHTDCGGVWAALSSKKIGGVLDNWLAPVRQIRAKNLATLKSIEDPFDKCTKLSELNIANSISEIRKHPSFVNASKHNGLEILGFIYDVKTGLLREIEIDNEFEDDELHDVFHLQESTAAEAGH